ncbi:hypothetical protein CFC21_110604 [Triticum aestivum]|uniref:DUF4228 domain-containing protein n=3 Tax=Triticinae TaxID=1648030 RepID=A0A453SNV9_AEGTS|nr:uncharacterized protein LOC109771683 [Aegilops tauschii subsp. strangulata]XP_044438994.1 uncharacterized protein LOC123165420 [Triticum aestivum]KAF7110512.1 hypothetical protein CFC21_110604 [Triticum aestivum]
MGCGFSSGASGGGGGLRPFAGVRVIHTNGYVEDFPAGEGGAPVTVARATASSPSSCRYVLCSSAHLLQPGRALFRPDDALQPGTVYFLLPHSIFQAESSAVDLACLMNRLTALARKGGGPAPSAVDALFSGDAQRRGSPEAEGQTAKPPRPAAKSCAAAAASAGPWRPRLDRIDESMGRSSMRSASTLSNRSSQD